MTNKGYFQQLKTFSGSAS